MGCAVQCCVRVALALALGLGSLSLSLLYLLPLPCPLLEPLEPCPPIGAAPVLSVPRDLLDGLLPLLLDLEEASPSACFVCRGRGRAEGKGSVRGVLGCVLGCVLCAAAAWAGR